MAELEPLLCPLGFPESETSETLEKREYVCLRFHERGLGRLLQKAKDKGIRNDVARDIPELLNMTLYEIAEEWSADVFDLLVAMMPSINTTEPGLAGG